MRKVVLLALVAGCAPREPVEPKPILHDYRGIIHCHSLYSHDSQGTYEEILAAAKKAHVDFLIMTDHPPKDDPGLPLRAGWHGLHDGVLFIQGAEIDNLLAMGITEPLTVKGRQAKIDAIHAQGGLAFIAHPEEITDWSLERFDGMEIYNVHATLKRRSKDKNFPLEAIAALKKDPEKAFLLLAVRDENALAKWDELNQKRRVVGIAANDAHQNVNYLGVQLDPYERAFKFVSTHVLAEELTEKSILSALKAGRCYVQFELVEAWSMPIEGFEWLGREIRRPTTVHVREAGWAGFHGPLHWYGDGAPVTLPEVDMTIDGGTRHFRLEQPGVYRIEYRADRPWIFTNPIRFVR